MRKDIRQVSAPLALMALFALSACTVKDSKSDTTLAQDTALNRDLVLANRDTAAQPQLRDVPANPAATAPAPAPTRTGTAPAPRPATTGRTTAPVRTPTPAPAPRTPAPRTTTPTTTASGNTVTRGSAAGGGGSVGTIASGTRLSMHSNARVCTNTYQVGQTFTATTTEAVTGSNGATIPAGATVSLEVTQLKRSENVRDNIVMEFAVKSVSFGGRSYPLSGNVDAQVDRVRNESKAADTKKVIGGAAIGAIAGQILGKNTKSTVIGAAAGAAAGAGAAAATSNYEGCVPDGGSMSITLSSPVQVKIS